MRMNLIYSDSWKKGLHINRFVSVPLPVLVFLFSLFLNLICKINLHKQDTYHCNTIVIVILFLIRLYRCRITTKHDNPINAKGKIRISQLFSLTVALPYKYSVHMICIRQSNM